MVGCLTALVQYLDRTCRLLGNGSDQVGEQLAADQSRARARHQNAVGREHVQCGHVETQIALESMLHVLGLLGVLGRVADDHFECLPLTTKPFKNLEHIASLEVGLVKPIERGMLTSQLDRSRRAVDTKRSERTRPGRVERKPAGKTEQIEYAFAATIPGDFPAIDAARVQMGDPVFCPDRRSAR